jgi:aminomethyltransferase
MGKIKETPFHAVGLEVGATMMELFGYYLPWEYATGHEREHLGTRNNVSLCDLHYMGEFLLEGPQVLELVQKLCVSDIAKKRAGSIKYTTFCNEAGNMVDDGTVWRLADDRFMIISGDEGDYAWIEKNAAGFDVQTRNITDEHTTLALQGPKSMQVMRKLTSADLPAIGYYCFINSEIKGVPVLLARMGYTGEFGYEIHFHPRHGREIWTAFMEAGADAGIVPLGQAGLESLRQEAGYLLVGNDHDISTNPLEAGLGKTIDFDKRDFNGKSALEEIRRNGIRRLLVWFRLPDKTPAKKGDGVFSDGQQIGEVTSSSYSPGRKSGTAIAYVKPSYAMNGALFRIRTEGREIAAQLSLMPLYDPGDILSTARAI